MIKQGKYGYFDDENREYVITTPRTPTPWINYLGDGEYGGIISNTAGGYSFDRDPRYKRVLRYRYNAIPEDQPGRYIYLRDDQTSAVWSATWQPVKSDYDFYECRHGLGYSVITQHRQGIHSTVAYFVPMGEKMEYWRLRLRNTDHQVRKLTVFSYAEFSFFDAAKDQQNVDWVQQIQQGTFENNIIFWNAFMRTWDYIFMTSDRPAHSFDTSRESFIGRYGDLAKPLGVESGACANCLAQRGNGVGVFCHKILLEPGEEKEITYLLGTTPQKEAVINRMPEWLNAQGVQRRFDDLKQYWNHYLNAFQVETPNPVLDLMLNTWNPYQCKTTFNWSRFVSLYQLGIDRGMGLRDSAQDILGVVHAVPEKARTLLIKLLGCQFKDGHAYHLFYPLTGEGGMGEAQGGKYNWYSDDHLWLVEATVAYLKETGDFEFLKEKIRFAESDEWGTVWDHLAQALEFTSTHLGVSGLPLNGYADWNDALNLDRGLGRAESVWTGMLFCRELRLFVELALAIGAETEALRWQTMYQTIKTALNQHAWDGQWYLQAFDDAGRPVGSKTSGVEEQIYLNPQSWAVLSGIAPAERALTALTKVDELLGTPYGFAMLYPAYQAYREDRGGVTTYPPGAKENGGIFVHTNPWLIIAELLMDLRAKAYNHYQRILPPYKNDSPDRHEVEPYVYCQNILGKEHPQFGMGRNSWLTGTAAWAYVAGVQYLLGIRPDYQGLTIDPRVPDEWRGYRVKRRIRGFDLEITFQRDDKNKGITVNGQELPNEEKIVPYQLLQTGIVNRIRVIF